MNIATNLLGLPAGTYPINRAHINQNFVIQKVIVSYIQTGIFQNIQLNDPGSSNGFSIVLPTSTGNIVQLELVPKVFKNPIFNLIIGTAIPANQWISITLSGWYEDK